MKGRQTGKLIERFVGPYKMKRVILINAIELELPDTIRIHPVVNMSRIRRYKEQVLGQKKQLALPVIIEEEEEYKVKKIMNKRKRYSKWEYLVKWKGYITEEDSWKRETNLKNAKETVEEYEKKYG